MRRLLLRHRPGRWGRAAGLVALVGWLVAWLLAAPATAHGDLVGGSPGPGDDVRPGGTVIQLEFADLDPEQRAYIAVAGPDDAPIPVGRASITGESMVCARSEPLEQGVHTLDYSATSTDGHRLSGRFTFEVSSDGSAPATGGCDEAELAAPGQAQTLVEMTIGGVPGWLIPVLILLAVLAAGGVLLRIRHDRRQADAADARSKD